MIIFLICQVFFSKKVTFLNFFSPTSHIDICLKGEDHIQENTSKDSIVEIKNDPTYVSNNPNSPAPP